MKLSACQILTPVRTAMASVLSLGLVACATPGTEPGASAELQATRGNAVTGSVRFAQKGHKVRVTGEVRGLKPHAEHGFHVHEKGDCSSGDGMSAGGHFNPSASAHGQHGHGMHHAGDLPSLKADAQGVARVDFETDSLSVAAGARSVVGRGLIVHRDPDDFKSQPAGNAGARVACGVIRM